MICVVTMDEFCLVGYGKSHFLLIHISFGSVRSTGSSGHANKKMLFVSQGHTDWDLPQYNLNSLLRAVN